VVAVDNVEKVRVKLISILFFKTRIGPRNALVLECE